MSAIPYLGADILDHVEELRNVGFTEEQAKAQIRAMQGVCSAYGEAFRQDLATKTDILAVRNDMRNEFQAVRKEIQDVRNELKNEIQDVRNELKNDIQDVRNELKNDIQDVRIAIEKSHNSQLSWTIAMMLTFAGVLIAAMAYFK